MQSERERLFGIAMNLQRQLVAARLDPLAGTARDVAQGCAFLLSSARGKSNREGKVGNARPYFFHTLEEDNPSIMIDLGAMRRLHRIVLTNRTDAQRARAQVLLCRLHDAPDDAGTELPLQTGGAFCDPASPIPVGSTNLGGVKARFVTISAVGRTCLHLSGIAIFASDIL